MAIPVQTGLIDNNQANPTETSTTAWTSNTTVGNLIVYSISVGGTTNTTAPTVSSCNNGASTPLSFLAAVSNGTGGNAIRLEMWYAIVQAASRQISVTASGGPCNLQITSAEYAIGTYTNVVDVSSATNTGSGTTITTGTIATLNPNDLLIFGCGWVRNQTAWTTGPTNSFTDEKGVSSAGGGTGSNNTSAMANNINDQVVTTAGNYSSGGTIGAAAKWSNVLVAFRLFNPALAVNEYNPLELEQVTDDLGDEPGWYSPMDVDTYLPEEIIYTELFVENDYEPDMSEVTIDDLGEEPAWYPPIDEYTALLIPAPAQMLTLIVDMPMRAFGDVGDTGDYDPTNNEDGIISIITIFDPGLIINDYEPDDTTIASDDLDDDPSWYTPQEEYLAAWFWTQPLQILIIDMPIHSFGDVGDTGDYDPYNDESAAISIAGVSFNPALIVLDYSPDPWADDDTSDGGEYDFRDDTVLLFTIYTELFVENDYAPLEVEQLTDDTGEEQAWYPAIDADAVLDFIIYTELFVENDYAEFEVIEDTEGDIYPDFSIDLSWYFAPQTLLIFNDYVPLEAETLIEDSEGDYYPDFSIDLSFFLPIVTENFIFNDYAEFEVIEDTEGDIYPDFGIDLSWYFSPQTLLVFNDYVPTDNEELIEDSEGDYYPDFSTDVTWFLPIVTEDFVFNDYSPTDTDQLLDDTGEEQAWYAPQDELLSWFIPPPTDSYLVFNDYEPDLTDMLFEDIGDEQAWYPAFADDAAILFAQDLSFFAGLDDYSPDPWADDDTADGSEYDPLYDNVESWYSTFSQLIIENPFIDYLELYTDDSSDSGEYDLPFEELLQWFIPPPVNENFIFNEYVPSDNEQLIEDSEGDFYPDFSIDLGWYFAQVFQLDPSLFFEEYIPWDTEQLIEDDGSEQAWYPPIDVDNGVIPFVIYTELFVENDYAPLELEQLIEDDGSDQAWYPPTEELLQWFIPPYADPYLVFNDYTPWEAETLTEESEGDYYPDFSTDITWFLPIVTENFIFNDYSPLELEQLTDDDGSEQAWYPPIDVDSALIPFIIYTELFVENDYAPLELEQLTEDEGSEQAWYPPQDELLSWFIPPSADAFLVFNDYSPSDHDELIEDSEGDFYPDFSIDLSWFLPIVTEVFVFIDYSPLEVEQLTEDDGEEQSWYPPSEDNITPTLFAQSLLDVGFEDYSPMELEQLTEDLGDGTWYDPFWDDSAILFAESLFPFEGLEFEWKAIDTPEMEQEDQGDEDIWYGPFGSIDWIVTFFVPPIPVENLIAAGQNESYGIPDPFLSDDDGDLDSWYGPIYDADEVTFFLIGQNFEVLIASGQWEWAVPDVYEDDTGDEMAWYHPWEEELQWFIPLYVIPNLVFVDYTEFEAEESEGDYYPDFSIDVSWLYSSALPQFVFVDYAPLELEQLIEDSEGDFYPDFSIDLSWYFSPSTLLVFNDLAPLELDQLLDDTGEEQSWYPPQDELLSWFIPPPTVAFLVFNDYSPEPWSEDDSGDEQAWYPPQDELLSWFIPPSAIALLVFNESIPWEVETLTEESEGDYYPDFSIDLSWYFNQVVQIAVFLVVMANQSDDSGNAVPLSFETVMDDLSDEPAWYTPMDTDGALVSHTIVTVLFIENDYAPLELEQLTEESEGDYYPDFSIDLTWYVSLPSYPANLIFEDYSPREFEAFVEDDGSEESWHYGLYYLGIIINYTYFMDLYLPALQTVSLYMPLIETTPNIVVLYFPLSGTGSGGNIVGL